MYIYTQLFPNNTHKHTHTHISCVVRFGQTVKSKSVIVGMEADAFPFPLPHVFHACRSLQTCTTL